MAVDEAKRISFFHGKESGIQAKIDDGTITASDLIITSDTDRIVYVDADKVQHVLGSSVKIVDALPETGQIQGVIYINTADQSGSYWNGTEWVNVFQHVDNLPAVKADVDKLTGDETVEGSVANQIATVKSDIEKDIDSKIAAAGHITRTIVDALPTENIDDKTIYMVANAGATDESDQHYEEWMYINSKWEKIGDSAVDLSDYYTKAETDDAIKTKATEALKGSDEDAKTVAEDGTVTYADTLAGQKAYVDDQLAKKLDVDKVGIEFTSSTPTIKAYVDDAIGAGGTDVSATIDTKIKAATGDLGTDAEGNPVTVKDYVDSKNEDVTIQVTEF